MAAAGFGKLRIVDCDRVGLSNLNRQVLHWSDDVGRDKAESALETLCGINPEIEVEARVETISEDSIDSLIEGSDLIMDAMDNFPARYLLNQAALRQGIPLFHGAISGLQGQATTLVPGNPPACAVSFPTRLRPQSFLPLDPPAALSAPSRSPRL